jgi:hypothetical protein
MTPVEQQALDEFINEELKTGKIRPSKSPYASPIQITICRPLLLHCQKGWRTTVSPGLLKSEQLHSQRQNTPPPHQV